MKKLIYSILVVFFLFNCTRKENYDDILRKIMVKHVEGIKSLKGIQYKDTILENGDLFFGVETEAEHYSLKGNYSLKEEYLVFNLYENYWDGVSEGALTGIFKKDKNDWISLFQDSLANGTLDTIIDLNNDKINEILVNVNTSGSHGADPCNRVVLYAQTNTKFYEEVGVVAERITSNSKLVKDYSFTYEQANDTVIIYVKSEEGADLDSAKKVVHHRYFWLPPQLKHIEEPEYAQVKIGNQIWMAENLNVATFRNGDSIPKGVTINDYLSAGANKKSIWFQYGKEYSKWYNGYAVYDSRGLAPKGWHIPSNKEWEQLITFLGGKKLAIIKLKSQTDWDPMQAGSNESGFSAKPFGVCVGDFESSLGIGVLAQWWAITEDSTYLESLSWYILDDSLTNEKCEKNACMSVRCIKD